MITTENEKKEWQFEQRKNQDQFSKYDFLHFTPPLMNFTVVFHQTFAATPGTLPLTKDVDHNINEYFLNRMSSIHHHK